jgi:threonine dehydrogenase-like Zn-dependent dehydrogenase
MLTEPAAVALHAVLRRAPRDDEHVLVLGAGIIGLLVVQAARAVAPGCRIAALARYAHQAEAARRLGTDEVLRRGEYAEIAQATGARHYQAPLNRGMLLGGFDVIYDCVGSSRTVEDSLRWAKAGGAVVLVGVNLTRARVDLNPVWYQEVDLVGSLAHGADAWQGRRCHTYEWVYELFRSGRLTEAGLITHRFPFRDYRQAVATSMDKKSAQPIKVAFQYET